MNKLWLIAKTHYRQMVRSGTFLFLTFGVPILMVVATGISILVQTKSDGTKRLGYVDESGSLAAVDGVQLEDATLLFQSYGSQAAARAAFESDEIEAYLVIPSDYLEGGQPQYFGAERPNEALKEGLRLFLRRALLPDAPGWALERLRDPSVRTFVALSSGERVGEGPGLIIRIATPGALSVFLGLTLLFSAGQTGSAVVREKDQRAMEIVISSVSPTQLVAGKVLAVSLLSLTQFAVWGAGGVIGLGIYLTRNFELGPIVVPWQPLIWMLLLGIPGYLLFAALAAGLGIIAGDAQQAQQLAGLLGLFGVAPFWLTGLIVNTPNSPVAVGLSLFPLTGPTLSLLRMSLTEVPNWQLLASFAIVVASLIGALWMVARLFRVAMLMYGQALGPRQIWRALRQA